MSGFCENCGRPLYVGEVCNCMKNENSAMNSYSGNSLEQNMGYDMGTILGMSGEVSGLPFQINVMEELMIGRDGQNCHIVVPNKDISRRHCAIHYYGEYDGYGIIDFSSYGTFVEGEGRLIKEQEYFCPKGTKIYLGNSKIEFLLQ